jgi:hypothetical protein
MLTTKSKARLWNIATNDILYGGAKALVLANRMQDPEGLEIVSSVYSVSAVQSNPYASHKCGWCGCDFCPDESGHDHFCSDDCAESYGF